MIYDNVITTAWADMRIIIGLPENQAEALRQIEERSLQSQAELILQAISDYVRKHQAAPITKLSACHAKNLGMRLRISANCAGSGVNECADRLSVRH